MPRDEKHGRRLRARPPIRGHAEPNPFQSLSLVVDLPFLGDEAVAEIACRYWDVTEAGNFEGRNILHLAQSIPHCAKILDRDAGELVVHDGVEVLPIENDFFKFYLLK